jgi:hypothetical protein
MKKTTLCIVLVMQFFIGFTQQLTGINGKIVDLKTQISIQNAVISVQNTNLTTLTNTDGKFLITGVSKGNQLIQIKSEGYKDQLLNIEITDGQLLDLGVIAIEEDITSEQQNSLIVISENELNDENSGSESTLGLLQSSRDTFLQAAAFNFGQSRFSVRGIDNEYATVMINGVTMNKSADGRPQYGDWGGLNDATRNQEFTNGSSPSDYTFGGIAGTQEINTRASIYRPGTRLSFLTTNTNYSYRAMATHASGMNKNGWAFTISGGRRWSDDAYFDGTNYSANSLFSSVEKRLNDKHSLNFTSIFTQNKRSKNSPNTDEVTDLLGFKYNSYWGYQEGKKRNSRFKDAEEPLMMLTHYWKINSKTNLNTTVSYQIGQIGNSRLDYTKSDNPDPVYYKNLPSYYTSLHTFINNVSVFTPNPILAENAKSNFLNNAQLDWKNIYRINTENLANGSRIVLFEDRNDENIATINSNLTSAISDNLFMTAGINYEDSRTENFKNLLDLLGGSYFIDRSTFGYGVQNASDLNNPNRQVKTNDRYGYNYNIYATRLNAFTQFKFTYNKIDFYLAQNFSQSSFQREGFYINGYYPENSFGKSEEKTFDNFGFKGGLTYKITGKHLLDFNAIYMSKSPNSKDVFPYARANNLITDNITNEKVKGVDASYIIRAPKLKARFTGYFSEIQNVTDINFYYADGISDSGGGFVSEVITGINKKNRGIEVGIEYQITATLKIIGAAGYGEYTFANNPDVLVKDDKNLIDIPIQKANITGYKQPGMPQQAYSFGIEYRDPKFWWISANANYLSDSYIDFSVIKRTPYYVTNKNNNGIVIDQNKADEYLKQEKFNPIQLLNLVGGKSWRIANTYTLGLFANVNNVLNYKYKTGGFEQSRSPSYINDFEDRRGGGVGPFGSKYFFGYGRTYTVNIYLTF